MAPFDTAIYSKVARVIGGCRTIAQLLGAYKYATLYVRTVPSEHRHRILPELNRLLARRKAWIIRNGIKYT